MTQLRRILCAVDLSPSSPRVLEQALALGRHFQAPVTVLHVFAAEPMPVRPYAGPVALEPITLSATERDRRTAALAVMLRAEAGVPVETRLVEGDPAGRILEQARESGADLVVVGTHGASGLERVLGSVTERVVQHAPVPVMSVPVAGPRREPGVFHLLCAFDYSYAADAALSRALAWAEATTARLTVLEVRERPFAEQLPPFEEQYYDTGSYVRDLEEAAIARLRQELPEPLRDSERIEIAIAVGHAGEQILNAAEERRVDLIVMGVQGRNAVDRMLFGSTTRRVLRGASCPVLTVREG